MSSISSNERPNPAFYVLLALLIFMSLGPIVIMLLASLQLNIDILDGAAGLFLMPTLENYETVLCDYLWYKPEHLRRCDPALGRSILNSLFIASIATAITLIFGAMAAYAIVRFRFMGRSVASLTTLIMRMVPPAVLLVPVFAIWTGDYGLEGTYSGIILIYVAMNLPFVIWILQSFISQVPIQLEEAAKVDGAGSFRIFFMIILPLIRPGLAAAAIFTFRIAWNEFLLANALAERDTRTAPVNIVNSITPLDTDWGVLMATGMLLAVPPIIFTFLAAKQIITGMTAGAVKG